MSALAVVAVAASIALAAALAYMGVHDPPAPQRTRLTPEQHAVKVCMDGQPARYERCTQPLVDRALRELDARNERALEQLDEH